jgi:hypothetical protein
MTGGAQPVQLRLVAAGPLRDDFGRFLTLLTELDPAVSLREEPFQIVAEMSGRTLCRCRPKTHAVQVRLGPPEENEVRCRSHEDFVDILLRLLAQLRAAAALPPR